MVFLRPEIPKRITKLPIGTFRTFQALIVLYGSLFSHGKVCIYKF